ncbi:acyl-CoA dehydrogenase family protein [Pseudonocardia sp. UM4_GMWB1]|uniref:acyl-CoA dehydrogenase family protein n=2 Tax=Pseudonocardia TaxID=1847 RepID=UPI0009243826|nr:acyl-CoA dehydrogenase family protein [Pseudonocardia sp. SID8383]MYW75876.1 acyl-CoA dehydrogenase [Pseudonocardia sp. SID8383]OJG06983.1 Acyl-CoA dehydrogenase, short-chain specific [Pseudonocardia autotrophica]
MSAPSDADLVAEAVGEVLRARCPQDVVAAAERTGWAPELWAAVAAGGFPWVSVPEDAAGGVAVGGSVAEACAVLEQVGRYAAPLPVAETGLLGGWLLAAAGFEIPSGPVTTAATAGWSGTSSADTGEEGRRPASVSLRQENGDWVAAGSVARVPWAREAARIVLLADSPDGLQVVALDPGAARITPGTNLAAEPRDTVHLDDVPVGGAGGGEVAPAPDGVSHDALLLRGALSRAALIAGAAGRILDITVTYTGQRQQFGRPVARFQAVAAHLVRLAEQTETVRMAARVAAANTRAEPPFLDIAAAATVAGESAGLIAAAAHQATGAMGMTREYELGQLTRRLWSWREEYGGERVWSTRLGAALTEGGAGALWPAIARGAAA